MMGSLVRDGPTRDVKQKTRIIKSPVQKSSDFLRNVQALMNIPR